MLRTGFVRDCECVVGGTLPVFIYCILYYVLSSSIAQSDCVLRSDQTSYGETFYMIHPDSG